MCSYGVMQSATTMGCAPIIDWAVPNPANTFKLFMQRIELYFEVNEGGDEGLNCSSR